MAIYSIRDLEKLTGIKAHTIRIWEQRYGMITPGRTETNIRFYTDENLRLLFNIALLNRNGLKISKLAKMSPEDIAEMGAQLVDNVDNSSSQIEAMILSAIDMDEQAFERVFSAYVSEFGFETTMVTLIYPFLDKLRVLWLTSSINPAQEKFIGQLIRCKLMSHIDQLAPVPNKTGVGKLILYSPEGESQELALLFIQYLCRVRQLQTVYLGSNLSLHDLQQACELLHPDFVMTIIQDPIPRQSIQGYVDEASQCIGDSQLLLTGDQLFVGSLIVPSNTLIMNGLSETLQFLDSHHQKRK